MSALDAVNLEAHPIGNLMDVEVLRRIRNECRLYMTGDIKPISESDQAAWFDTYRDYGPRVIEVWLILRTDECADECRFIGFLSLRYYHETTRMFFETVTTQVPHATWDRGKVPGGRNEAVITLGLTRSERDRGYGTAIYAYAREVAGCPVRAEIQNTNRRSMKAAMKAGYETVESPTFFSTGGTIMLVGQPTGESDG